jgi:hypothetical protein
MSNITHDEQHKGRNAVSCLHGFLLSKLINHKISKNEYDLVKVWLANIGDIFDKCNKGADANARLLAISQCGECKHRKAGKEYYCGHDDLKDIPINEKLVSFYTIIEICPLEKGIAH